MLFHCQRTIPCVLWINYTTLMSHVYAPWGKELGKAIQPHDSAVRVHGQVAVLWQSMQPWHICIGRCKLNSRTVLTQCALYLNRFANAVGACTHTTDGTRRVPHMRTNCTNAELTASQSTIMHLKDSYLDDNMSRHYT